MSLLTQRPSATPGTPPPPGPRGRPHPFTLGAVVMAIGASAFVHVNRSALPSPWATVALAPWIVAVTLFCWATIVRAPHLPLARGHAVDKIGASYSDGALTLTIPVAETAKPRKIEVQHSAKMNQIEGSVETDAAQPES